MFKLDENPAFGPHNTRSAMQMTAKPKFRLDLIDQAHRALEALPEHRPEELTKAQAIEKLIGPIRASQAKGYSLTAIGNVLCDNGIPITPGALRLYVSGTRTSAARKTRRKAKRTDKQPLSAQPKAPAHTRGAASTQPAQPAARPAGASPGVDLDWHPAARTANAAPSPAGSPRPGFYVRPDREKI
jgi:hypothetical protein